MHTQTSTGRLVQGFLKWLVLFRLLYFQIVHAKVHEFHFKTNWKDVQWTGPHGKIVHKRVIAFNDEWPLPEIHVNKGDRVLLYLTNGFAHTKDLNLHNITTNDLDDGPLLTSLHFHGMFHNVFDGNHLQMDGASMVTQCPIASNDTYLYNFTVANQVGTYWYHAHEGAQYGDGMRSAFIIHDPDAPFQFDEEFVVTLSDLYLEDYRTTTKKFLSRYNPTGAEPIPQYMLINDKLINEFHFETDKTYFFRFINVGLFVSQYISFQDHSMTVVEIDGVYVKPNVTNTVYIAAGQRISVLVHSKRTDSKNFALWQVMDQTMLDDIPLGLDLNITNAIIYDKNLPWPNTLDKEIGHYPWFSDPDELYSTTLNEFHLQNWDNITMLPKYDKQITLDVKMENLGDGVNYAFFNNITYTVPVVPILTTVMTSGELCENVNIYSANTNPFILKKDEIIELVLNNYDDGRHPFHLHGHNFQIIQKSQGFNHDDNNIHGNHSDSDTVPYDEKNPLMDYPEFPAIRDTVVLEPNGHVVLRFKADNPGVWYFHCHVDWHLQQGLAAVFIEDPKTLQEMDHLDSNYMNTCSTLNIPNSGNAVGDDKNWFNMDNLPRQPPPLPSGFTLKGYIAIIISSLMALWGGYTIVQYGFSESIPNDQLVYDQLTSLLETNK